MSVNVKDLRRNDTVGFRNGRTHVVSGVKQYSDYECYVYFKYDQDFCYDNEGRCKRLNYAEWFDMIKVIPFMAMVDKFSISCSQSITEKHDFGLDHEGVKEMIQNEVRKTLLEALEEFSK